MKNLTITLENRPGALAEMGEALGRAGVSIEGGGVFVTDGVGVANFLFDDAAGARAVLEAVGIRVVAERDVLVQRLRQDEPGQLGVASRRLADAGTNIVVQYSDHRNQLILVVDEAEEPHHTVTRALVAGGLALLLRCLDPFVAAAALARRMDGRT
jgi:hypothetical protein